MTNQALKVQPSRVGASDPIAYFQSKTAAIEFAKQQNWAQVNKLTKMLINEYQHDGDTWYVLGLSYFQLADYQNASNA
ncbi:MAG: hypothetical protein VX076_05350, partial [Pseudomonadota bacterium]|nr:hypothetical protein [Pseudomonadota bacterium]